MTKLGRLILITIALGAAIAGPASAAETAPTLIRDVRTGSDPLGSRVPAVPDPIQDYVQPDTQIEPSIAVNPANPRNVVAVYQEGRRANGGDATNGFATSFDGGATWTSGELPGLTTYPGQGGPFERASDAVVAFGPGNVAYANSLVFDLNAGGGLRSGMAVNVSKDGGRHWSAPVVFQDDRLGGTNDKNWIVVDNSDAPGHHKGRVYVVWDRIAPVVYNYCDDHCDEPSHWLPNFQTVHGIVWPGQGLGAYPLILHDGGLGIVLDTITDAGAPTGEEPDVEPGSSEHVFIAAPQAGSTAYPAPLTFLPPVNIASNRSAGVPAQRASDGLPAAAVDPKSGDLYTVWDDGRFRSDGTNDAVLSRSTDNGLTWSKTQRVNPGSTKDHLDHYLVTVAADRGLVHVAYRRRDESGKAPLFSPDIDTYYQQSRDGGKTFTAPLKVDSEPSNAYYDAFSRNGSFEGDYDQTASAGGYTYVVREQGTAVSKGEPRPLVANPDHSPTLVLTESGKGHQHQRNWVALVRDTDCLDRSPPVTSTSRRRLRLRTGSLRLRGRSRDSGCVFRHGRRARGKVARVYVSVAKVRGKGAGANCRFVNRKGRLTAPRRCRRPILLRAHGRERWRFRLSARLPRGRYRAVARAFDTSRNKERPRRRRNIVRFAVR